MKLEKFNNMKNFPLYDRSICWRKEELLFAENWIFINNSNSENIQHHGPTVLSLESNSGESAKGVTGSTVSMVASTTTFRRSEGRAWERGYSNIVSTF